jgi:putative membrane protein
MLTAWIAGGLGIGFHVQGFWNAVWGSIVITLVTWFIDVVVLENDDRRKGRRPRRSWAQ